MTDEERGDLLLAGFQFAFLAYTVAYDLKITAAEHERVFDLLHEIVDGETTIRSSPADLLSRFPDADPSLTETAWKAINALIAEDRETARLILDAYQRYVDKITRSK